MFKNSKILITGGSGMLGRHVARILQGYRDTQILTPTRHDLNLEDHGAVSAYFEAHQPDYVFHLAAKVHGLGGNLSFPLETLSANIRINDSVLSACAINSVKKIFFAGTVASYGYPYESVPLIEDVAFNGAPHRGEFGYAMAKRIALTYLEMLADKYKKQFVYGMFTNLYGPHDRFDENFGHVVPSLVLKLKKATDANQDLSVWGRPDTTRDFLHAHDAARAAVLLMEKGEGQFNIASGIETRMSELVSALLAASGRQPEVIWESDKPVGIARRFCDVERLRRLEFQPSFDIVSGLADTWNWFIDQTTSGSTYRK
jgi:GDP-L-fucose synthase